MAAMLSRPQCVNQANDDLSNGALGKILMKFKWKYENFL